MDLPRPFFVAFQGRKVVFGTIFFAWRGDFVDAFAYFWQYISVLDLP
jgi:hypothetical protein